MPKENRFEVEYAKSNMSTCRVCMAKIPKEALRIGHFQVEPPLLENDRTAQEAAGAGEEKEEKDASNEDKRMDAISNATRWHHFECFPRMKGQKWMDKNLPSKPSSMGGFAKIKKADQKKLEKMWTAMLSDKTPATSSSSGALKRPAAAGETASKKAKKDTLAELTSPQGVLSDKDYKKVQKNESELSSMNAAQLRNELDLNKQVLSGKKEELVQRVAEGRALGALPRCPRCEKGRIHWSRIGGWHSCPGYYDKDLGATKRCYFRSKDVKRGKWKRSGKSKSK